MQNEIKNVMTEAEAKGHRLIISISDFGSYDNLQAEVYTPKEFVEEFSNTLESTELLCILQKLNCSSVGNGDRIKAPQGCNVFAIKNCLCDHQAAWPD